MVVVSSWRCYNRNNRPLRRGCVGPASQLTCSFRRHSRLPCHAAGTIHAAETCVDDSTQLKHSPGVMSFNTELVALKRGDRSGSGGGAEPPLPVSRRYEALAAADAPPGRREGRGSEFTDTFGEADLLLAPGYVPWADRGG